AAQLCRKGDDAPEVRLHMPEKPIVFAADPLRLTQAFTNLLCNAIKFSPPAAQVDVSIGSNAGEVSISVEDYGPGIEDSRLPHIFNLFYQDRGAHKSAGLGLGLHLSQHLVQLHG